MNSSGSPITSESTRTTSRPAEQARARPPPFTSLAARRTVLSSRMSAPAAARKPATATFSANGTPRRAAARTADPPPLIAAMTTSAGPSVATKESMVRVAASARSVGRLIPAGRVARTSTPGIDRSDPSGTLTSPVTRRDSTPPAASIPATPAAIAAAAFPPPTTTTRLADPMSHPGSNGRSSTISRPSTTPRRRRTSCSGSTAASPALAIAARSARGLRGSMAHPSPRAGKFLGSNRDRSMPPRPSSSRSFIRISSRSSRRASSAGDSAEGATLLTRGMDG